MITSALTITTSRRNNKYLIWLLKQEIKNEEVIVSNASKACHNVKTFIVCFLLPFLGAALSGYFGSFKIGCQYKAKIIYLSACTFILSIVFVIQIFTHLKFYAIQTSHRKRLESLNLMLGTAIRNNVNLPSPFSYETLKDYLKITENISNNAGSKNTRKCFFKDALIYFIPMLLMLLFCFATIIIITFIGANRGW